MDTRLLTAVLATSALVGVLPDASHAQDRDRPAIEISFGGGLGLTGSTDDDLNGLFETAAFAGVARVRLHPRVIIGAAIEGGGAPDGPYFREFNTTAGLVRFIPQTVTSLGLIAEPAFVIRATGDQLGLVLRLRGGYYRRRVAGLRQVRPPGGSFGAGTDASRTLSGLQLGAGVSSISRVSEYVGVEAGVSYDFIRLNEAVDPEIFPTGVDREFGQFRLMIGILFYPQGGGGGDRPRF